MIKLQPVLVAAIGGLLLNTGCSDGPESESAQSVDGSEEIPVSSLGFRAVETEESAETKQLRSRAAELLAKSGFDELDKLAGEHRALLREMPAGLWSLSDVYSGLALPTREPDEMCLQHIERLRAWIRARPKSITARVALASAWIDFGWKARGSGYADTVSANGWRLFEARLSEAIKVLNDAKRLDEVCPLWWSRMMDTARGLGMERRRFDALFREATERYPEYGYYYYLRGIHLLPRWHGKPGEWEADLKKSADQLGGEKGDLLYARVVWRIHRYFSNVFQENQLSWERVSRGFDVLDRRFPNSLTAKSMRASLAVFAVPPTESRKLFDQLEGKVDLSVWETEERFRHFARDVYGK